MAAENSSLPSQGWITFENVLKNENGYFHITGCTLFLIK